jgi:hypothetical protein
VTFSCSSAHIKEPQPVYVLNFKFGAAVKGTKSFDYKGGIESMGEWVEDPKQINWSDMPENIIGFPLEIWLTRIKPALKKLARRDRDDRD